MSDPNPTRQPEQGNAVSDVMPGQWRAYEDIAIGQAFEGIGRTITESDILMMTVMTTGLHQPLHTNSAWVKANTPFRGVILPGPVILAYAVGMLSASLVYSAITVAFLGLDRVRATGAVYANDTLTARAVVSGLRLTSNRANGILELDITVSNQSGMKVMSFLYSLMVRTRGVPVDKGGAGG